MLLPDTILYQGTTKQGNQYARLQRAVMCAKKNKRQAAGKKQAGASTARSTDLSLDTHSSDTHSTDLSLDTHSTNLLTLTRPTLQALPTRLTYHSLDRHSHPTSGNDPSCFSLPNRTQRSWERAIRWAEKWWASYLLVKCARFGVHSNFCTRLYVFLQNTNAAK